jgi:spermidine/putrescine-binding protein
MAKVDPRAAAKYINEEIEGGPKTREFYGKTVANSLTGYQKIDFLNELNKQIYGEAGKKLSPLALQTAQGASSLQQMGGGDIVSAVAFSPAQQTAENTAKSAEELSKIRYMAEQESGRGIMINKPKGSLYRSK